MTRMTFRDKTHPGQTRQGKAGPGRAGPGRAGPGQARPGPCYDIQVQIWHQVISLNSKGSLHILKWHHKAGIFTKQNQVFHKILERPALELQILKFY